MNKIVFVIDPSYYELIDSIGLEYHQYKSCEYAVHVDLNYEEEQYDIDINKISKLSDDDLSNELLGPELSEGVLYIERY